MNTKLLSIPLLVLLAALWITPGLVGRDPWKADEPYTFGLVNRMIRTGDWVVPSLTGEPFIEKPPVFFVTAAVFGRLFSPPLDIFAATRLATVFFMFLALLFLALTARELYGKGYGAVAVVLLLGCITLQVTAHKLITDVALFAGFAVAFYGLALSARRSAAGGFWLGTGTGLGFLAKGLIAPGVVGIVAALLPFFSRAWRRRAYVRSLAVAFAAALPWLIIWPVALYRRSPGLFVQWFWDQNFGRFLGFNRGMAGFNAAAPDAHSFFALNLPWLAWPVIVPAVWALWHFRRSWRDHPLFQIPLAGFLVMLAVLSASATNRVLYALPLLLPLTLMAAPGVEALPRKAKEIGNGAALLFFGVIALLIWLGWIAMITGRPASIALKFHELQPDYVPAVNGALLAAALFYTAAWLLIAARTARSPEFVMVNWTLGVVLTWALVMTLWLPFLNTGSSYRAAFTSLRQALPGDYSCVASLGLGESERGMLEYFAGVEPRRIEAAGPGSCDLLLEERGGAARPAAGPGWRAIWEYRQPSVRPKDIFTLYRKTATSP